MKRGRVEWVERVLRPLAGSVIVVIFFTSLSAQGGSSASAPPSPQVTIDGRTWTQQGLFQRNLGAPDEQTSQFPPHKVIGNIYT
jgi:hypothetical protein